MDEITSEKDDEGSRFTDFVNFREKPLLYISGPMASQGNPYANIKTAIELGAWARECGWAVIVPHLDCLFTMVTGIKRASYYLDNDFNLLSRCDAVCVLPYIETQDAAGVKCGTAQELDFAELNGIPIYTSQTLPSGSVFNTMMELEEAALAHRTEINADI